MQETDVEIIYEIVDDAHKTAVEHGWWDGERNFGELIALCHSELSEALAEYRNGHEITEEYIGEKGDICGVPIELADVCIRIFDMCGEYGIDLGEAIQYKMEYNKTRPMRHGGKKI